MTLVSFRLTQWLSSLLSPKSSLMAILISPKSQKKSGEDVHKLPAPHPPPFPCPCSHSVSLARSLLAQGVDTVAEVTICTCAVDLAASPLLRSFPYNDSFSLASRSFLFQPDHSHQHVNTFRQFLS